MKLTPASRRVSTIRKLGWLGVASMLALALLAPAAAPVFATTDAVAPVANDNACNNVVHGADSLLVWLTTSDEGLTVHWNQADTAFGTDGTVVVRACVNGHGAWSQNDTNDGIELFPWSVFGLETSPCPGADGQLGGSVDGGTPFLNTQKANGQNCTTTTSTTSTGSTSTGTTSTGTTSTGTTSTGTTSTGTTSTGTTSTGTTSSGTTSTGTTSSGTTSTATTSTDASTSTTSTSTTSTRTASTGTQSVLAETFAPAPHVTLPPTDSLSATDAPSADSWRILVIGAAALLAGVLVLSPATASRRR